MNTLTKSLVIALATVALPTAANAAVTIKLGDNSLTDQIHLDPAYTNTNVTTVHGLTQLENPGVDVSFTSASHLDGTGGNGYAQISADDANTVPLTNLQISLTNGGGFTAEEFTIQFPSGDVSKNDPGLLTIGYDLVGGGSGTFTVNTASCAACASLSFANSSATDFQIDATGGDVIQDLYLTTNVAFDQVKQNDIQLAAATPALPEPGTWAMMLLGFGAAGVAMRRSRKNSGMVSQIA